MIRLSAKTDNKPSTVVTEPTGKAKDPLTKIIRSRRKYRTKRFTRSQKRQGSQKAKPLDIMEIETKVNKMLSEMQSHKKEPEKKPEKKPEKEPEKKPEKEPEKKPEKPKPIKGPKRDLTLRNKRPTKGTKDKVKKDKVKKVRIKNKAVTKEDIKEIEEKIAAIRAKKPKDIKEDLAKEGIKVSGKSSRLLKDIYFYSKVCNINITHEK
jgi:hypothetical protein